MTNPIVKTLEEPFIEVNVLESKPPVQDSAKETLSLFFFKYFNYFLRKFFHMKTIYKTRIVTTYNPAQTSSMITPKLFLSFYHNN